jgi:uncharacterized protein (TIGR02246 family)
MLRITALLLLFAGFAFSQPAPNRIIVPHPTNIDFREGEPGSVPTGWHLPPIVAAAGYRAELRTEGCGGLFTSCVAYLPPPQIMDVRAAELQQIFPAESYAGKKVRFSAWLRMENPSNGYVHIRTRVYYPNQRSEMFEEAGPLVNSPDWQRRDVLTRVGADAVAIAIWARYVPGGYAWVAYPSLEIVDPVPDAFDDANVRKLISDFSERRNAHDGVGVASLYLEEGRWLSPSGGVYKGREGLAILWGQMKGEVQRTIQSADFISGNVALVRVSVFYPPGWDSQEHTVHHDAFVLFKEGGNWFIQDHQAVD